MTSRNSLWVAVAPWLAILLLFFALPQLGIRLSAFTVAWLSVMIWGGAFNTENFRAGFEAVPYRYREAGLALGLSRLETFFRVTLPIGGRISLPSTINTHVSVLKNTSLMTASDWRGSGQLIHPFGREIGEPRSLQDHPQGAQSCPSLSLPHRPRGSPRGG